jgi:hypothetical protein
LCSTWLYMHACMDAVHSFHLQTLTLLQRSLHVGLTH